MPLIPCLKAEVMHFFIARRKATRFRAAKHVLGDEDGVSLGLLHFDDVEQDFVLGQSLNFSLQLLDASALLADHDARAGRVNVDLHLVRGALDFDLGDAGARKLALQVFSKLDVSWRSFE